MGRYIYRPMPPTTPCFTPWQHFLAPLGRRTVRAVHGLRQLTLAQIEQRLGAVLPLTLFASPSAGPHSRERVFTLSRTFWCWLWQVLQAHTSCREVVRQVQALFALRGGPAVDEGTAAYCQARGKLPRSFLARLFGSSFARTEAAAPAPVRPLLGGRTLRVVDASSARVAESPANRAAWPPSANVTPGAGCPVLRIVVLFSLLSGAILAQASGSLGVSELRLWLELLPHLQPGEILLGDRAYSQYVVLALLQAARVDYLGAVATRTRKVDFRRAHRRLGPRDALFRWTRPGAVSAILDAPRWQALPAELTVRMLRVELTRAGYRTKHFVVVTTLLDPERYPAAEIIAAYARRWRLEMCFDDLKTTLGMESLRCQSPEMVEKELLVFLTAHNLVRWLLAQTAQAAHCDPERLSFKGALDAFRQWSEAMAQAPARGRARQELWTKLLRTIAADAVPWRPGRSEPRAVKTPSKYPKLNKPRRQYVPRWNRTTRRRAATAKKRAAVN